MKFVFLFNFCALMLLFNSLFAQNNNYTEPHFKGGFKELDKFIQYNVGFPNKIETDFIVTLLITKDGKASVKEIKGIKNSLMSVIYNAVKVMPDWEPALIDSTAIDTTYAFKLLFSIDDRRSFFEPNVIEICEYMVMLGIGHVPQLKGEAEFNIAVDALKSLEYEKAIKYFNKAASVKLKNIDILYGRAIAYINTQNSLLACNDIYKGYDYDPEKFEKLLNSHCSCLALNNEGYKNLMSNNLDTALLYFNLSLKYFPNDTSALYYRAISNLKQNNKLSAVEDLNTAIELGSINSKELLNKNFTQQSLAGLYYKLVKQYSDAKDYQMAGYYIDKIIAMYPDVMQGYLSKAELCFLSEKKEDACINLKKAVELGAEIDNEKEQKYCY